MVTRTNGSILVESTEFSKLCSFCGSNLNMEEGVMIYDKNWYHNGCWNLFENPKEVIQND